MFDQSLFNSLVRGHAVLCDGTVVNARLGNSGLAVRQSPVSQLSLRPSWQPEAEPDANAHDYAIAALAVKRAGRPVRTAGVLSSRTRHGEGTSLTAAIGTELSRSVTTASVGKSFPTARPSWHRHAPLTAMMRHCRGCGRPAGRTMPASRAGHGS